MLKQEVTNLSIEYSTYNLACLAIFVKQFPILDGAPRNLFDWNSDTQYKTCVLPEYYVCNRIHNSFVAYCNRMCGECMWYSRAHIRSCSRKISNSVIIITPFSCNNYYNNHRYVLIYHYYYHWNQNAHSFWFKRRLPWLWHAPEEKQRRKAAEEIKTMMNHNKANWLTPYRNHKSSNEMLAREYCVYAIRIYHHIVSHTPSKVLDAVEKDRRKRTWKRARSVDSRTDSKTCTCHLSSFALVALDFLPSFNSTIKSIPNINK